MERAVGDKGSQSQNAESGRDHDVHSREHQAHDRLWVAHAHTLVDGDANFMCQVDWAYRCLVLNMSSGCACGGVLDEINI